MNKSLLVIKYKDIPYEEFKELVVKSKLRVVEDYLISGLGPKGIASLLIKQLAYYPGLKLEEDLKACKEGLSYSLTRLYRLTQLRKPNRSFYSSSIFLVGPPGSGKRLFRKYMDYIDIDFYKESSLIDQYPNNKYVLSNKNFCSAQGFFTLAQKYPNSLYIFFPKQRIEGWRRIKHKEEIRWDYYNYLYNNYKPEEFKKEVHNYIMISKYGILD